MKPTKIEVYRSGKSRDWLWRIRARNGRIIAIGGEGYERRGTMLKTVRKLFPDPEAFPVVEIDA